MKSREFVYWLQGYFELLNQDAPPNLDAKQVAIIQRHLALVFKHEIDPEGGDAKQQAELNEIHSKPEIGGHTPGHPDILIRC